MYIKSILIDSLSFPFGVDKIDFELDILYEYTSKIKRTASFENVGNKNYIIEYDKPLLITGFEKGVYLQISDSKSFNYAQRIVQFYPTDDVLNNYPTTIRLQQGKNDVTLNVFWK